MLPQTNGRFQTNWLFKMPLDDQNVKVLLLIPDGIGVRNFILSQFLDRLVSNGEVLIWHSLPEKSVALYKQRWPAHVKWEALPSFREGLTERILRQSKIFAQLYWRYEADNSDATLKFLRPSGRFLNHAIGMTAHSLGRIMASSNGAIWLDRQHAKATLRAGHLESFKELLRREQPNVVFCTQQRSSRAVPAMLAARALRIPTATFIYSWDNLPKGRMAVHADHYLVWSDFMKDELLRYYPEVSADSVHVVGTPQFEHYSDSSLLQPREEFLRGVGLDPARQVVCFSGADLTTSPYDPTYLADVTEALRQIPEANRPQILFRRCPVDTGKRYRWVLEKYPEIGVSDPVWFYEDEDDWSRTIPTIEDTALLANVVHHCDLVVNMGSTMAMDFAIQDKPAIFVDYDPPGTNGFWSIKDSYRLPHLRSVHELQPAYWARTPEELSTLIVRALTIPQEKSQARQQWLARHVMHPLKHASERCFEALRQIAVKK
jgi:hypothetical protein